MGFIPDNPKPITKEKIDKNGEPWSLHVDYSEIVDVLVSFCVLQTLVSRADVFARVKRRISRGFR